MGSGEMRCMMVILVNYDDNDSCSEAREGEAIQYPMRHRTNPLLVRSMGGLQHQ